MTAPDNPPTAADAAYAAAALVQEVKAAARPPCASLNGAGRPCRYRAKRGDIYCKRHRRCECCDNRCPAMSRLCRPCELKGCAVPPGPARDPGEWAQFKAARRRPMRANPQEVNG